MTDYLDVSRCPSCGNDSIVLDSRVQPNGLTRSRRCVVCRSRWQTVEVEKAQWLQMRVLPEMWKQLVAAMTPEPAVTPSDHEPNPMFHRSVGRRPVHGSQMARSRGCICATPVLIDARCTGDFGISAATKKESAA